MVTDWLIPLVSVLAGGGLIVGLLKVRPEAGAVATIASERAVTIMQSAMDDLDEKVDKLEAREQTLIKTVARCERKIDKLTSAVMEHEARNGRLETERDLWKARALRLGWKE